MQHTPVHTYPNKSHFGEGLGAFSTGGNRHPFFCLFQDPFCPGTTDCVRATYSHLRQPGELRGTGHPQENTPLFLKQSKLYTDIFYYLKFLNNVFYLQIKPDNKIVNKHELPSLPNCRQYLSSEITGSPFIYLIHINEKIIIIVK